MGDTAKVKSMYCSSKRFIPDFPQDLFEGSAGEAFHVIFDANNKIKHAEAVASDLNVPLPEDHQACCMAVRKNRKWGLMIHPCLVSYSTPYSRDYPSFRYRDRP